MRFLTLDFPPWQRDFWPMKNAMLFLVLLAPPLAADALWDRAVALFETSKPWLPQKSITTSQEFDDKGKVVDQTVTHTTTSVDAKGKILRLNTRIVKNGVEQKPDAVARATDPPKGPVDPLDKAAQKVTKLQPPVSGTWASRKVNIYDYVFAPSSGWGYKGRIWLDAETAVPVHRESSLEPKPPFVDVASFVQDSELDPRGFVYTSKLQIAFKGSFLGLKKSYGINMEMADYAYLYK